MLCYWCDVRWYILLSKLSHCGNSQSFSKLGFVLKVTLNPNQPSNQPFKVGRIGLGLDVMGWKQQQQQPFNGLLSGTTQVSWYQKKHSPTHTYHDHQPSFIIFPHLLRSVPSSLFNLCAWKSLYNLCPSPLWSTSCSGTLHTPHISSPNHCLLFAAHTNATNSAIVLRLCHGMT